MTFDGAFWEFDRQLFVWLNNAGFEALDGFMLAVSGTAMWIPWYAFLIYALFKTRNTRDAIIGLSWVVVLILLCDQISVHAFKEVFERLRPCHEPLLEGQVRLVKASCGGQFGFVSSHATNTFGLAVFLGGIIKSKFKWLPIVLLIWAALVSYSRIWLGVHYPMDVLGGALLGTLIARFVLLVANRTFSSSTI